MKHFAPPYHATVDPIFSNDLRIVGKANFIAASAMVFLCLLREFFIGAFGTATTLGELKQFAAFDEPQSILNWITSTSLFLSAVLIFLLFSRCRTLPSKTKTRWSVLSATLAAISIDKIVNAHQLALGWLWFGGSAAQHVAHWIALVPAVALAFYLSPIFRTLPRKTALKFATCGCSLILGAIVLDGLSSQMAINFGFSSVAYRGAAFIEEVLEALSSAALFFTLSISTREKSYYLQANRE